MKKRLLFFLSSVLLLVSCNQAIDNNPRIVPDNNLVTYDIVGYGPIAKCDVYYYWDNIEEEYDEYILGKYDYIYSYVFDETGRIIQADYPGQRDTYEYSDSTCIFKSYYLKKLSFSKELNYNSITGILNPPYESVKEYDSNGRVVEEFLSTPSRYNCRSGEKFVQIKYVYEEDKIIQIFVDTNGVIVRESIRNSDGYVDLRYSKGELCETLTYDCKYNILTETFGENRKTIYKYEFDEKGNWVKREMYRENDNIPSSVVLRTFEYFK